MTFQIELSKCRYTMQGLDVTHMFPLPGMTLTEGPILVSYMNDDNYFVHDGRHRCIRGQLRGDELIDAMWLEDWEADRAAAQLKQALAAQTKPIVLHTDAISSGYASFNERPASARPYDFYVLKDGQILPAKDLIRSDGKPLTEEELSVFPRYDRCSPQAACGKFHRHDPHGFGPEFEMDCDGIPIPKKWKAKCGRDHLHQAHDFGEHMEEWCNGYPSCVPQ